MNVGFYGLYWRMASVLRIIDANANRSREALRVMEEAARFLLDDADLTAALKSLRHDLAAALQSINGLELHRDTPGDVGVDLSTRSERDRASAAEVVIAAGKRLSEALRAIEEYGKTIDSAMAQKIERLRYRAYELEKRLIHRFSAGLARQWRLCVILTAPRKWGVNLQTRGTWAQRILNAQPDCVQLREKGLDDDELLRRARWLVDHASPATTVIINDRPDIALMSGAHGVHLGQHDLPCAEVRKMVGRQLLIGVSTSRIEEAQQAIEDGADYCGVGPMFASETKQKDVIVGPAYVREYVEWNRLPHLAIGGIAPGNIEALRGAGVRGVAVCGAICNADDPAAMIEEMQTVLQEEMQTSPNQK